MAMNHGVNICKHVVSGIMIIQVSTFLLDKQLQGISHGSFSTRKKHPETPNSVLPGEGVDPT